MEFEKRVLEIDLPQIVKDEIFSLIENKRSDVEIGESPRNEILSKFIEDEFNRYEESGLAREKPQTNVDELTRIFHEAFDEVYGNGKSA